MIRVVNVSVSWQEALCRRQTKQNVWFEAIVVKNVEVSEESSSCLYYTDLKVGIRNQPWIDEMISCWISRVALHDVELRVLISEGYSRNHICTEINA
jgi:hypothetical protein